MIGVWATLNFYPAQAFTEGCEFSADLWIVHRQDGCQIRRARSGPRRWSSAGSRVELLRARPTVDGLCDWRRGATFDSRDDPTEARCGDLSTW